MKPKKNSTDFLPNTGISTASLDIAHISIAGAKTLRLTRYAESIQFHSPGLREALPWDWIQSSPQNPEWVSQGNTFECRRTLPFLTDSSTGFRNETIDEEADCD